MTSKEKDLGKKLCDLFDNMFEIACKSQFKKRNEMTDKEKVSNDLVCAVFGLNPLNEKNDEIVEENDDEDDEWVYKKDKEIWKEKINDISEFVEVSKDEFFKFSHGTESDIFMGWYDIYDWSLSSGKYEKGTWEYANECKVARIFNDKYYIKKELLK